LAHQWDGAFSHLTGLNAENRQAEKRSFEEKGAGHACHGIRGMNGLNTIKGAGDEHLRTTEGLEFRGTFTRMRANPHLGG
jgi:hypothetical protein